MNFEPIAIVGQSCVFPGSLTPLELWENIKEGKDLLSNSPADYWRMDKNLVLTDSPKDSFDLTWTDRGGYVTGFNKVFNPDGFAIPKDEILKYDTLVHWLLHTAREALKDAGCLYKNNFKC
jgi:acyl transferase domain-containing protein